MQAFLIAFCIWFVKTVGNTDVYWMVLQVSEISKTLKVWVVLEVYWCVPRLWDMIC